MLASRIARTFGIRKFLHDLTYTEDTSSLSYKILSSSPLLKPQSIPNKEYVENPSRIETTKMANGITIISQSSRQPGTVNMGISIKLGTRDETDQNSGALLSIKNTYLKTVLNTNQTVNYGMVQMSGGKFQMDYDKQITCFKAYCLPHDVVDIFSMVADCALQPRSVVAAQVALKKNSHSHKLDDMLGGNYIFTDNLFKIAFGNQGIGRSIMGSRGNVPNLNSYTLQKFQLQNIHPQKVAIVGVGIDSHNQFVDLVTQKLGYVIPNPHTSSRSIAQYQGGQLRSTIQSGLITLALAWQGSKYNTQNCMAYQLISEILGNSLQSYGKLYNLVSSNSLIDNAESFNYCFQDTGLWGIKISGSASNSKQILQALQKVLKEGFNQSDLQRAKGRLKFKIMKKLDKPYERVQMIGRQYLQAGNTNLDTCLKQIQNISLEQVHSALKNSLSTKISLNAKGGLAHRLPSYDSLMSQFKP